MELIKINVENKRALTLGTPVIVCGNSDYQIEFTFDEEWADLAVKTVRFTYVKDGKIRYTDIVMDGNLVNVPVMTNVREVLVGVFAGDLVTTTPARVPCDLSIRCGTGAVDDPTPSQYDQIMALLNNGGGGGGGTTARIGEVTLPATSWTGSGHLYSQVVTIDGVTVNSQVDLTPSVEQLVVFYEKDLSFVTENEGGVVTVYAIGEKPQNTYTIQVTITEVA